MSGWESVSVSFLTLFSISLLTRACDPSKSWSLLYDEETEKMIGRATSGLPDCSYFRWTTNLGTSSWSWSPARHWQGWRSSGVFCCPVWLWASLWTLASCLCPIRDFLIRTFYSELTVVRWWHCDTITSHHQSSSSSSSMTFIPLNCRNVRTANDSRAPRDVQCAISSDSNRLCLDCNFLDWLLALL